MAQHEQVKNDIEAFTSSIRDIINAMPDKGNTCEESQKICLLQSLNDFENNVNGISAEDFEEEEERELVKNHFQLMHDYSYSYIDNHFNEMITEYGPDRIGESFLTITDCQGDVASFVMSSASGIGVNYKCIYLDK